MADQNPHPEWLTIAASVLAKLDKEIVEHFGLRVGMIVFAFDFEHAACGYVSNAERDDTVTMLIEWLGKQEPERLAQAITRWRAQKILPETAEPN